MSAMAYSTNPYAPRARREAINLVLLHGFTAASAARKTGVHRSTIGRWLQRPEASDKRKLLGTRPSRPYHCPFATSEPVVKRILELRWQLRRCAEVIWHVLRTEGIAISLSTVGRVLARHRQLASWHGTPGKQRRKNIHLAPRSRLLGALCKWIPSILPTGRQNRNILCIRSSISRLAGHMPGTVRAFRPKRQLLS